MVSNKENKIKINNELTHNSLIEVINTIEKLKNNPKSKKSNNIDSKVFSDLNNKNQQIKDKKIHQNLDYFSLINRIMHEKSFYEQGIKFNYDNYSINDMGKKQLNFQNSIWETDKKHDEKKGYDAPLVENSNLDKFLGKVIMMQNMGHAASDYTKPEGMSIDEFEKINNYKKINSGWIKIKYNLVSVG
jgi:hypothetical protein